MESSSSEDDFNVILLLKKSFQKVKYWVCLILKSRQEPGEFHLLMKRRSGRLQVYFRTSAVLNETRTTP